MVLILIIHNNNNVADKQSKNLMVHHRIILSRTESYPMPLFISIVCQVFRQSLRITID
jgi:hypothetical protein